MARLVEKIVADGLSFSMSVRQCFQPEVLLAIGLLSLSPGPLHAQNMIRYLLGEENLDPADLATVDRNNDGIFDIADFIFLLNLGDPPIANFAESTSTAIEENIRLEIPVIFDTPFQGDLSWEISGTAELDQDYSIPVTSLAVHGTTALIPIDLIDDDVIDPVTKTIEIQLVSATGYRLGGVQSHTIYLSDNDRVWDGAIIEGYSEFPIAVEIVQLDGQVSGSLVSDGSGSLPEGTFPLENVLMEGDVFQADVEVAGETVTSSLFGTTLNRRFEFRAGPGIGLAYLTEDLMQGAMTQRFIAEDADDAYLNREIDSNFILTRRPLQVPVIPPPLIDVNDKAITEKRP